MNIDLRSCRHVVVLSRLLSYTKAAQELCLTQSALTRMGPLAAQALLPAVLPNCRPYLSGPLHVIEDYGVASRITECTDAIWLGSTFAAATELRTGCLREIPVPRGQRTLRFRMLLYNLDKRSLSPAAMMLKDQFQKRIRALGDEVSILE